MVQTLSGGGGAQSLPQGLNQGSALCKQREVGQVAPPSRPISSLVSGDGGPLKWCA